MPLITWVSSYPEATHGKEPRPASTGRRIGKVLLWTVGTAVGIFVILAVIGAMVGKRSSEEKAQAEEPGIETPAENERPVVAKTPTRGGTVPESPTGKLPLNQQIARAAGFLVGQQLMLNRVGEAYPDLEEKTRKAKSAFVASFGTAKREIGALVGDKHLEFLRKAVADLMVNEELTRELASAFIAEVEARARGEIESPFLEVLLAYQYANAPHEELANGYRQSFTSKDHPKAKGLEVELVVPRSWTQHEGRRPNVVQVLRSHPAQGIASVVVGVRDTVADIEARTGEPMGAEAIRELESRAGGEAMIEEALLDAKSSSNTRTNGEGPTMVQAEKTTLDNLPALHTLETRTIRQTGLSVPVYEHGYLVAYERYTISLVLGFAKRPEQSEATFREMHERWRPLLRLIANSLVVQNQWRK